MKHLIGLVIIALITFSCSHKAAEYESAACEVTTLSMDEKVEVKENSQNLDNVKNNDVVKKKIIKDGRLGIKVEELKKAKTDIDTLVKHIGAYYDKENLTNDDYSTQYDLKIRIPADKFELFISKIEKGENTVSYKEIEARDVTEEFIDLETRLTNKQKYMARYQELLKMAKSMKEILEIQEKIRGLEEEIESTTGRLKYMIDQVNYSTLELNVSQKKEFKYTPEYRASILEKLKQSFIGGWYSFVDFIFILLYNWAYLIIFGLIIYKWLKYRKNKKNKKSNNDLNQDPKV